MNDDRKANQTMLEGTADASIEKRVTRRSFVALAGKAVFGATAFSVGGPVGAALRRAVPRVLPTAESGHSAFHTRPDLDPPRITVVNRLGANNSGFVFLTPSVVPSTAGAKSDAGTIRRQEGVEILDEFGNLVWFDQLAGFASNLRVQSYQGKQVLTYWNGHVTNGIGRGVGVIVDNSYRQIAVVRAGNGLHSDVHDFTLTPQNTALITAYQQRGADLSGVGGASNGVVQDCVIQEIDVASGRVLFEWHSLDHIGVDESYAKPVSATPFDYFHLNSVDLDGDEGSLLASARNTWSLYRIDRTSGSVVWRLGGKKSDYTMGPEARFAWQHHATRLSDQTISLFDDGATPVIEPRSRAMVLKVDDSNHTVSVQRSYTHPGKLSVPFEGSAQVLANGHMFVGWGIAPYFSEFDHVGHLVLEGRLEPGQQSYRAFRMPWVGRPAESPAIAVGRDASKHTTVFASWNGATEVASWQALTGSEPGSLRAMLSVPRDGFETAIALRSKANYVAVVALDRSGRRLGRSRTVPLS